MAHHIYQTDAFVLEARNVGEANKQYALLTKDLGLIFASAQSVREVVSKLRGNLQEFTYVHVALVKGKNGWKLTSALSYLNYFDLFRAEPQKLQVAGNVFKLLKRLLTGEEKNELLFSVLINSLTFLAEEKMKEKEIQNAECVLVLSILHTLGYVGERNEYKQFIQSPVWTKSLIEAMEPVRSQALAEINRGLKASHL